MALGGWFGAYLGMVRAEEGPDVDDAEATVLCVAETVCSRKYSQLPVTQEHEPKEVKEQMMRAAGEKRDKERSRAFLFVKRQPPSPSSSSISSRFCIYLSQITFRIDTSPSPQ